MKFIEEQDWRHHIAEGHKFTCDECNAIFVLESHLKYHKNEHHASSSNLSTAAVGHKCDEAEASVEKEQARNSSVQNALFDEPISRTGSIEENLSTLVPSIEPNVHNQTVEVQGTVELPTSIPSV